MTPEQIIKAWNMRQDGINLPDIAVALGIPASVIQAGLRAMSVLRSKEGLEQAEEFFQLHLDRLEKLWANVQDRINKLEAFDDRVFKLAIQILERQSRLLGLDRGTSGGGRVNNPGKKKEADWLEEATPMELVTEIESYGLEVPARFKDLP